MLTEITLRHNIGASIDLPGQYIPGGVAAGLFSETPGRVIATVHPDNFAELDKLAESSDVPIHVIGESGGDALVINDASISLSDLRQAFTQTLPKLFG